MATIIMSGPVRAAIGPNNARAVDERTVGLAPAAQCWWCGHTVLLGVDDPGEVTLSVLVPRPGVFITLFGHAGCKPSTVVDEATFAASPAQHIPAQVEPMPDRVVVEGRPVDL